MPGKARVSRRQARPARRTAGGTVEVSIGRFGSVPETIRVQAPATVGAVLEKADIVLEGSERVWLNGEQADLKTRVKAGDIVGIVSPKEASSL